jgi:hypothetical protein
MLRRLRFLALAGGLMASLAFLAACGGGNDNVSPTSTLPEATATSSSLTTPSATTAGNPETPSATEEPFQGARDPVDASAQGSGIPFPVLTDVRTSAHSDYDRITFEFAGNQRPHYRVEYITAPAISCGSGEPAPVAGTAVLQVRFRPANAHDDQGASMIDSTDIMPAFTTLLEAKLFCDFEADVAWAVGLSQEADFRVLELDNPPRIVVDVGHP